MSKCRRWFGVIGVMALIGFVSASGQIPAPEAVLGHKPGDDFFLASYQESLSYFQRLDAASDRVQLINVGKTSLGRDWYLALISSPENLANLGRYKEIARRLADVEGLTDDDARQLAREGKAIVHIDGGLHSTEVAHAQHTIQLAYDLASTRDDPRIDRILENVILILWFSINPDGQEMVVDWYRGNLGTPYEVAPIPFLYQKYVGHDNNRDGYMNNMLESQVVTRTTLEYNPQVFYNHHQTAPFPARIWIPPFAEPISSNVHPLMWRWVNLFGTSMAAYLEERDMPGAIHQGRGFDDWYPGFIDHVNSFRNTVSFLTETALYRYATPHFYTVNDFPRDRRDLRAENLYASPWRGGWWRLGDAVRYMIGASMSVLDTAAKYSWNLQYNRYQAGRDVIRRFQTEPPFAYVIPRQQRDLQTAALLVDKLLINGIQVHQLTQPADIGGRQYDNGSWVILMDQPFAVLVKELFEIQDYPDIRDFPEGPPDLPYDVAGWTLPLQMGVESVALAHPLPDSLESALQPVEEVGPVSGEVTGSGSTWLLSPSSNSSFKAVNALLREGNNLHRTDRGYVASGVSASLAEEIASRFDVHLEGTTLPNEATLVKSPRIGLYRPWDASIDEGWTRWILENFGFQPISLYNAGVRAGRLRQHFDVIVIPDIRSEDILEGYAKGTLPARYVGGIEKEGLAAIQEFVEEGGTLVTFNQASRFAIEEMHLPVKDVLKDLKRDEFFSSGSLLDVEWTRPEHPLNLGMPADPVVMFHRGPAFQPLPDFQGAVLARYPEKRNPLRSGYILQPEQIQGHAALLDVQVGQGHVILFGFKPQWRGQTHGTYRLLFNSLYYFGDAALKAEEESRREVQAHLWQDIKKQIHTSLSGLIEAARTFQQLSGSQAVEAGNQLSASIAQFEESFLTDLKGLGVALVDENASDSLKEYRLKLKDLLSGLKSRDLLAVEYSSEEMAASYGLPEIEARIDNYLADGHSSNQRDAR